MSVLCCEPYASLNTSLLHSLYSIHEQPSICKCLKKKVQFRCLGLLDFWQTMFWTQPLDELHTLLLHPQRTRKFSVWSSKRPSHVEGRRSSCIRKMPSIHSPWIGKRKLCLDNEPVTSNSWKTEQHIWRSALIIMQSSALFSFQLIRWWICVLTLCVFIIARIWNAT